MTEAARRPAVSPRMAAMRVDPWVQAIPAEDDEAAGFAELVASTRRLLAAIAAASPPGQDARDAARRIDELAAGLEAFGAGERKQLHGRIAMPGVGNTMLPPFEMANFDDTSVDGVVVFARQFMGAGRAVHGGAVPLLFDDVMGRLVGRYVSGGVRTAYLHVDFRAVTPIDSEVQVDCRIDHVEGRKLYVSGELISDDTCTAQATALFVQLREGQA